MPTRRPARSLSPPSAKKLRRRGHNNGGGRQDFRMTEWSNGTQLPPRASWMRRGFIGLPGGPCNPFVEQLLDCEGHYIRLCHAQGANQVSELFTRRGGLIHEH